MGPLKLLSLAVLLQRDEPFHDEGRVWRTRFARVSDLVSLVQRISDCQDVTWPDRKKAAHAHMGGQYSQGV